MSGSLTPASLARLLGQWNLGAAPAYRELADVVRLLVLDGRVPLDVALPSERSLAATLGISRTTVTAAYALLREQGFLSSGQGSRSRTCIPSQGPRIRRPRRSPCGPAAARPAWPFRTGSSTWPTPRCPASGEVVHRAFAAALTELPALLPGFGYDALGVSPLREAIAGHYTAAGVPTTAAADPGDVRRAACAEHRAPHPGRPAGQGARGAPQLPERARRHPGRGLPPGARGHARCPRHPLRRTPAAAGWDLDAIESALMQQRPAMAYVVPDFHNPTGRLMPDAQRRRLVRAAAASGTVLVVDETLRELNLDGVASTPLAAFSPAVVSIGSLSKSHWAGCAPAGSAPGAPDPALRRRPHHDGPGRPGGGAAGRGPSGQRTSPIPCPARLAALRENRDALLDLHRGRTCRAGSRSGPTAACPSGAGCRRPISTALTVIAPDFGIRLAAGPRFGVGGVFEHYLRMPFTLPPEQLETAVLALRSAQDRLDASPQLRRPRAPPAAAIA